MILNTPVSSIFVYKIPNTDILTLNASDKLFIKINLINSNKYKRLYLNLKNALNESIDELKLKVYKTPSFTQTSNFNSIYSQAISLTDNFIGDITINGKNKIIDLTHTLNDTSSIYLCFLIDNIKYNNVESLQSTQTNTITSIENLKEQFYGAYIYDGLIDSETSLINQTLEDFSVNVSSCERLPYYNIALFKNENEEINRISLSLNNAYYYQNDILGFGMQLDNYCYCIQTPKSIIMINSANVLSQFKLIDITRMTKQEEKYYQYLLYSKFLILGDNDQLYFNDKLNQYIIKSITNDIYTLHNEDEQITFSINNDVIEYHSISNKVNTYIYSYK